MTKVLVKYTVGCKYDESKLPDFGKTRHGATIVSWEESGYIIVNVESDTEGFLDELLKPVISAKILKDNITIIHHSDAFFIKTLHITDSIMEVNI